MIQVSRAVVAVGASAGTASPLTTTSVTTPSTFTVPAVPVAAVGERSPGAEGMLGAGVPDVVVTVCVGGGVEVAAAAVVVAGTCVVTVEVGLMAGAVVVVPDGSGGAEVVVTVAVADSSGEVTVVAGGRDVMVVVGAAARIAMGEGAGGSAKVLKLLSDAGWRPFPPGRGLGNRGSRLGRVAPNLTPHSERLRTKYIFALMVPSGSECSVYNSYEDIA